MKKLIIIILLIVSGQFIHAQELYTKLIPINDTTIAQFIDINGLYFLKQENKKDLKKLINQVVEATNNEEAREVLFRIANQPNELHNVMATFDYYFSQTKPAPGSSVEKYVNAIQQNKDIYYTVNQKNRFAIDANLPIDTFIAKVRQRIGWQYGYGAFTYTSPYDSLYLATMKKHNIKKIDKQIIAIIEEHLRNQTSMFKYPAKEILSEVLEVEGVKDAIWDHCVTKTMQLPNWDNLGVIIVIDRDTIDRVYNLQIGKARNIRWGKRFFIPLKMSNEVWFRKAIYGLHYVRNTREQCMLNSRRD